MRTKILVIIIFEVIGNGYVLSFQLPPLENRIVGGQDTKIHEVPYQLSLFALNQFKCGASIIGSKWALTAAHCVVDTEAKNLKVGAGNEVRSYGMFYNIARFIKHKSYKMKKIPRDNDIALLEIDGSFKFGDKVKVVNLPSSEPPPNLEVTISGWGSTKIQPLFLEYPETLRKVKVKIVARQICKKNYSKINAIVNKNMICAGDPEKGGKDACTGDSGGPLVANNILYGIASWGKGCGRPEYPGVYTNVAMYRSWIKTHANI